MKRAIPLLVATTLLTSSAASAASFYVTARSVGGVIVHIDGVINIGDDQKFARIASRYPSATTIVEPDSPGGYLGPALNIAEMIWRSGLDTILYNYDRCSSACTFIWLSGRHAVIQRNTPLCFHQSYDKDGKTDPQADEYVAGRLQNYGLTSYQAHALVTAAPPESARCATEWWAHRLGFQPQVVLTPFAMSLCQSKFCLAAP